MSESNTSLRGQVFLVGAGPGDPGLLTLRGKECLEAADLVLYDGLVSPWLLRHTRADCERTSRINGPDGARLDQAQINIRLIEAARAGKVVVRLKGGDPFLFGRGSEEAAALAAAGISYEVVPGVTAALAAAAYAGMSLTHRQMASCTALVTGHEDPAKNEITINYESLARFPGTLVFYMGLHRVGVITKSLIDAGRNPETMACVVSRATTPQQRIVEGTLSDLPQRVKEAGLHAPSLIFVGETISQRRKIAWYEKKPLFGIRVAVTRPSHQAGPVVNQLLDLGAEPLLMPLLEIGPPPNWEPVDAVLDRLSEFDWLVLTSANGAESFLGRLWSRGADVRALAHVRTAAIGPATARKMEDFHLRADVVPDEFRAEGLVDALGSRVVNRRVLWAGANRGREVLIDGLTAAGADVEKVAVYESCDATAISDENRGIIERGELDWIGLASPSMARRLAALLPDSARTHLGGRIRLASISPVTTIAAKEVGLPIAAEAKHFTWDGLLQAIVKAPVDETTERL